jgi:hypothetical protein
MAEPGEHDLWSFPEGAVGHSDSVKGYKVMASDGPVGEVSWADYKPGESYLVVSYHHHLGHVHHVVPAGAVTSVDHDTRTCTLSVTCDEVKATPQHLDPETPVDWDQVNQFERGMLGGGFVWPYTDV